MRYGIFSKRLEQAEEKLSLDVTENEWENKMKRNTEDISGDVLESLRDKDSENEAIKEVRTELIPSGKIDKDLGIVLIEGIFSFDVEEMTEKLRKIINDL